MKQLNPYPILCLLLIGLFISNAATGQVEKLPPPVNLPDANQKHPSISPDGKKLLFLSNRRGTWDIYVSEKNNEAWGDPQLVESVSESFSENRIIEGPSFNYDGKRIYFSVYPWGKKDQSDIYYTEKREGKWSLPKLMPMPVNSAGYEAMPSITADNSTIYFVRDKQVDDKKLKDYDCKEIFFSTVNESGEWSEPKKMANPVNLECETCPQVLPDNNTLVLSSIRPPRENKEGEIIEEPKGGFDLYFSRRLFKHIWSTPSLLNVNSELNDLYGNLDLSQEQFVFTRKDEKMNSAIYLHKNNRRLTDDMLIVQGKIQDIYDKKPLESKINIINPNTSQVISRYTSNAKGEYYFMLNKGQHYLLDFYNEGYSHYFTTVQVDTLTATRTKELNVELYKKVKLLCNVYDKDIYEPIDGNLTVTDKTSGRKIETKTEKVDAGKYLIELPIGEEYNIDVEKEHYKPIGISLDLKGIVQFNEYEKDIEMEQKRKKMQIHVTDEETEKGMPVELQITNLNKNETIIRRAQMNEDGIYDIELREGDKYEININSQKGYAFYNKKVEVGKGTRSGRMGIKLKPLKAETKIELNNITFETNSAELDADSYQELERVTDLLKANDNIKIEISAHTDDVGSASYNEMLSQRRAQSVVNYLLDQNINKEQMESVGYGESKPLVPNDSEENRAKNRRVELEILEVKEDSIQSNL